MKKGNTVGPWLMRTSLVRFPTMLLQEFFTKALTNQHKAKTLPATYVFFSRFDPPYAIFCHFMFMWGNLRQWSRLLQSSQLMQIFVTCFFSVFQSWRNDVTLQSFQQPARMPRGESPNLLKSLYVTLCTKFKTATRIWILRHQKQH